MWQDQNIKLYGTEAVWQEDILCGLEPCGRTRILSCVERRQCGRRSMFCGLESCGRTRLLSCVARRQCGRRSMLYGFGPCGTATILSCVYGGRVAGGYIMWCEQCDRTRILSCVERRRCGMRSILCGLEPCGRTRILSCVERRQCDRRIYYVVLSRVARPDY